MSGLSNPSRQLQAATAAAAKAVEVIRSQAGRKISGEAKFIDGEAAGIVTAADLEAERVILQQIRSEFPADAILGEETGPSDGDRDRLWIVDPLDGTSNFAHGIEHYAVSIAYSQSGIVQCGVVANVATGKFHLAEKGRGAWHGDHQVSVNDHQQLDQTIVATGFYYDRGESMRATLRCVEALFERNVVGVRRFGSAALDLIGVGLGQYGAYFEHVLSPWDFAAGKLFVEEAGGKATTLTGADLPIEKTSILATNGFLHEPMLEIVAKHFRTEN